MQKFQQKWKITNDLAVRSVSTHEHPLGMWGTELQLLRQIESCGCESQNLREWP